MVKARYAELVAPEAPAPTAMAKIDTRHLFAREDDEDICGVYTQSGKRIKEVDGEDITAYRCDSTANDDPISVMMTIESEVTQTKTNDEGSPTVVVTTLPPVTATVSVTRSGAGAEQTGSENSDGGSETPIGAIVGGVVGGVALIALIAFGLWFIRFQKRKAAADNAKYNAQSPYGHPSTMQQAMYEHPYPGNQGNQAPIYHQLPADESDRPKPKTPPPVELPNNSV
ncbi:hypothetical protein CEP51_013588 [Fusarium floridanum]|uniref:Mid2 domain-containing protein n=1 Tax=Fusarium floridanum TaxID=1325733 RepID=A0A428Q8T6_9HYPO|nr:hypothetical protein CEP51_013588 [Fusarium floridanum]